MIRLNNLICTFISVYVFFFKKNVVIQFSGYKRVTLSNLTRLTCFNKRAVFGLSLLIRLLDVLGSG